ncbi:valyl-tRNA synthetase [Aliiroseovarius halocynthiae]|uniref:Valine--tRNA ligase n=1 Tax=Aliiroseovarius halocynthiae TaxID=985055 RepID=A0A545SMS7_9RHOB|nr:valine--tRNA ligase [Aliiroseovarius halocynthiae]TQV66257.1 valine--tRNA ligase [Aliiroseovarius halocynthiae]SMR82623.1 valyl-tRNA synthetase [Aliiroseovarius halocynthiae]
MAMDKTFDASASEARIYEKWESSGAFKAGANAKPGADSFTIMIPPPNVTGALHLGHAFNNTLQDILIRWHRMRGFDTLWQPGQDHAGIATQLQVEKMLAETQQPGRRELGREKFLEKVWEWKGEYGSTIIEQLKRLGSTCDWSRNAFTMAGAPGDPRTGHENSANFHDAVLKVFVDMYDKGLIYRGKRLVNWDPHFETAISDLEVENIETPGHMWHFKYPLAGGATYTYVEKDEDGNVTLSETRDYISIATTRPETMLGDGAVAVHPDDERYAPIVGKLCEIPVGPKEHRRLIPIITDEYPDMNFGSGAVKITGAHDFNDYQVAKRGGIPMYSLMDTRGAMRADGRPYAEEAEIAQRIANGEEDFDEAKIAAMNLVPDEYRGLDRFEARKLVVDQITAEGLAVMHDVTRVQKDEDGNETQITETVPYVENKPIMQPFGDRSNVVIEPMLTDQWFVDAEKIAGPALDAVRNGDVKILPESGEKTFYHWLENIEPWCISRQLWWGHQVPVWYGPPIMKDHSIEDSTAYFHPDNTLVERKSFCAASEEEAFTQAKAYYAEGLGYDVDIVDIENYDSQATGGWSRDSDGNITEIAIARDPDVLDTWFSSGLWPFGTLGWPQNTDELNRFFPGDVLITGQDILFFWVARMMMMSQAVCQKNPFHTVYLHGLVRDEKGKKMAKTTGNVVNPLDIIDEYGADALRFTNTAMASIGGVLKMSKDRVAGYRNFGTKLWNAARFAEMNDCKPVADFDPTSPTQTVNRWIISETAKIREDVDTALTAYRFNDAAHGLYAYVWGKVCDWYVEFSKPLLNSEDEAVLAETRATMAWVIDQCLIMLHPIMPFVTEELWGQIVERPKMLIHADWPEYGGELLDEDAAREMNWVISLIENIRSARSQMHVPAGLKIPVIQQELDAAGRTALENNQALVMRMARVDSITEMAELPKGCITVAVAGGIFALPLAEIIDVDEEIARLEKSLGKLAKELGGLRGRLKNPKFAENAPPEVLAETRANLAAREEEEATLNAALDRLKEI